MPGERTAGDTDTSLLSKFQRSETLVPNTWWDMWLDGLVGQTEPTVGSNKPSQDVPNLSIPCLLFYFPFRNMNNVSESFKDRSLDFLLPAGPADDPAVEAHSVTAKQIVAKMLKMWRFPSTGWRSQQIMLESDIFLFLTGEVFHCNVLYISWIIFCSDATWHTHLLLDV